MKIVHFPRWAEILERSDVDSRTREFYLITIRWYLSWCTKAGLAATNRSAQEFVEWAARERSSSERTVARWKEAIRWFFANGERREIPTDGFGAGSGRCSMREGRQRPDSSNAKSSGKGA